jgi:hypothetical protein
MNSNFVAAFKTGLRFAKVTLYPGAQEASSLWSYILRLVKRIHSKLLHMTVNTHLKEIPYWKERLLSKKIFNFA